MITLEIAPAMPSNGAPEWPDARWVGTIDATAVAESGDIRLHAAEGYSRARLLIRDGSVVRGFVDVAIRDGIVDAPSLAAQIAQLPAADRHAEPAVLPSFTVVVCTRDRPAQIRTALTAILALDYPHFNVVIVDNAASTTQTRDVITTEFTDPRVRLVEEPVPGLSQARNAGLARATGDIVAFTDDDVAVDPAWLRELAVGFARAPQVDCVSGLVPSGELRTRVQGYFDDRVSWSKNLSARVYSLADPPADLPMFPFCVGEFGTGANFALRRSAALALGGFDTAFGVGTRTGGGEDLDMFTRILLDGRTLVMHPSALVWHRHRDDLAELRKQARGYGNGLGSWLTKILLNPRTFGIALTRSPHAIARLVSIAWRKPDVSVVASEGPADEFDRIIARVGWYELASVAAGPWLYFRQRLAREGVIR
jgi:GT2 family glycosyltransferase